DAARGHLTDDRRHLGGADVQPDNDFSDLSHALLRLLVARDPADLLLLGLVLARRGGPGRALGGSGGRRLGSRPIGITSAVDRRPSGGSPGPLVGLALVLGERGDDPLAIFAAADRVEVDDREVISAGPQSG